MTFRIVDKNWHDIFENLSGIAQERALIISPFLGEKLLRICWVIGLRKSRL